MGCKTIIYAGLFELPNEDAAAHRVHGIGKMLIALGYNIVYIGFSKSSDLSRYNTNNETYYTLKKPENRKEWLRIQTDSKLILDILRKTNDVEGIFLYNYPSIPFDKIRRECRKNRIPVYADCTEWHHDSKGALAIIKNIETYKRIRFDGNKCDGLIVISSYLENYYKNKKTIKIPPVFDYAEVRKHDTRKENDQVLEFVFTGTVSAQKENVFLIVEAAKQLKDEGYQFVVKIFGVSEAEFEKAARELYDKSILTHVIFYGRVSHDVCIRAIQNADFQVFYREATRVNTAGFPTKFAESFSCCTPVITSGTSDIPAYLIDGVNGFMIKDNKVVDAMRKACELSVEERKKMRDVLMCEQRFDYRFYINKLNQFLMD